MGSALESIAHLPLSSLQGNAWPYPQQSSAHAQRIARAKWEFFYGSSDTPKTGKKLQGDALGWTDLSFASLNHCWDSTWGCPSLGTWCLLDS